MFTGIIEEIGTVNSIKKGVKSCTLFINANIIFDDLKIGDSVAVNGMCTTVVTINNGVFSVDIMAESLRKTSLGSLQKGDKVNLERAMSASSRFGGHIVSGHVDGVGHIRSFVKEDNAIWVTIGASDDILRYVVKKGSITIDGISLTVATLYKDAFAVSIIPHTAKETTLLTKHVGDKVNLECDIIGKYIEKFVSPKSETNLEELLKNW